MAKIDVTVLVEGSTTPVENLKVAVEGRKTTYPTDDSGKASITLSVGDVVRVSAFGQSEEVEIDSATAPVNIGLKLSPARIDIRREHTQELTDRLYQGEVARMDAVLGQASCTDCVYNWTFTSSGEPATPKILRSTNNGASVDVLTTSLKGDSVAQVEIKDQAADGATLTLTAPFYVLEGIEPILGGALATGTAIAGGVRSIASDGVTVDMERARRKGTPLILALNAIAQAAERLSFNNYKAYMDYVLCNDDTELSKLDVAEQGWITGIKTTRNNELRRRRYLPFTDSDSYRLLKIATEAFLIVNCGIPLDEYILDDAFYIQLLNSVDAEPKTNISVDDFWLDYQLQADNGTTGHVFPYLALIYNKLPDVPIRSKVFVEEEFNAEEAERCYGVMMEKLFSPFMVELIWSYWHEEGMLVQTMNAINRRFQNVRGPAGRDPLANMETDPLRPLNNLLWGYVQDEQHRLSVLRRAYEYDHHYGLSLEGDAVPALRTADSRSRFLEAFHQMLQLASSFYRQDDDTTMVADAFALLNALRDLHMILSEGAHNQYGDLPTTARIEMMMEQWMLSRPEFRELLPTRTMVAYPEPWMDRVDAMKRIQGWTDTSITHFRYLAVYGEQILLSARFIAWSEIDDADMAAIWARFFRNQVKGYIHAYRAVTGVDLSAETTTSQQRELFTTRPSVLLQRRLQSGQPVPALPAGATAAPQGFRQRRPARRAATD